LNSSRGKSNLGLMDELSPDVIKKRHVRLHPAGTRQSGTRLRESSGRKSTTGRVSNGAVASDAPISAMSKGGVGGSFREPLPAPQAAERSRHGAGWSPASRQSGRRPLVRPTGPCLLSRPGACALRRLYRWDEFPELRFVQGFLLEQPSRRLFKRVATFAQQVDRPLERVIHDPAHLAVYLRRRVVGEVAFAGRRPPGLASDRSFDPFRALHCRASRTCRIA